MFSSHEAMQTLCYTVSVSTMQILFNSKQFRHDLHWLVLNHLSFTPQQIPNSKGHIRKFSLHLCMWVFMQV